MNELEIFQYTDHQVRVILIDNEPHFVAKDIAMVLEHSDPSKMVSNLEADEVFYHEWAVRNFDQNRTSGAVLTEAGLYAVIMRSNKPQAKPFRRWVTHEVLPSIRKNGFYGVATPALPDNRQLALMVIAEADRADKFAALAAEQEQQLAIQAPKVEAYDLFLQNVSGMNVSDVFRVISSQLNEEQGLKLKLKDVKGLVTSWFTFKRGTSEIIGSTAYAREHGYLTEEVLVFNNVSKTKVRFTPKGALRLAEKAKKAFAS